MHDKSRKRLKQRLITLKESPGIEARWTIDKFEDPTGKIARYLQKGHSIEEAMRKFGGFLGHVDAGKNLMVNGGITVMLDLLIAAAGQTSFANGNSRLTVGTSSTAAAATNSTLTAFSFGQGCDATYPQVSGQTVTFRITVAGGNGNVSWQEFGADNYAGTSGTGYTTTSPTYTSVLVLLNHLVSNQGTKISGQSWILSLTITES